MPGAHKQFLIKLFNNFNYIIIMLKDIRVLEFEGLAPSIFCGMYFSDQGAEVILVARKQSAPFSMPVDKNLMNRGKKWVILSPKINKQKQIIEHLIKTSDIIIDPYRPGVLEKLGLGPQFIYKVNRKAILLRVSGYGQTGDLSLRPGHDLNYISKSGILPLINEGNNSEVYQFPTNYLADFVSCSLGITATLSALIIAKQTGIGRVVDCSLTDGCTYFAQNIELYKNNHHRLKQNVPQFYDFKGHSFLLTSKQKDKKHKKQQVQKTLQAMIISSKDYFKSDQFEISLINTISKFEDQVSALKNPFSDSKSKDQETRKIPKQPMSQNQISNLCRQALAIKSKL